MSALHAQRSWGSMRNYPDKPTNRYFLKLHAPDLQVFSSVVTGAISVALELFVLDFAELAQARDDRWYYSTLKEMLYNDEGDVKAGTFLTVEEYREFQRDPVGKWTTYYDMVGQLFEEIVELNHMDLNLLYESVNVKEVDVSICRDTILLHIRGTSA